MRQAKNQAERNRAAAKRAARPKVIRICQYREKKDGPICGIKFEAKPRIGKNGADYGVHPNQRYCPKHATPAARAHGRWLNRNVERYKAYAIDYRDRNLVSVRKKQRIAAKAKRDRVAATLAARPADWMKKPIEYRIIGGELTSIDGQMGNRELAQRLDLSRIIKCPYASTWTIALSGAGRAANYISDIRKWMKRPGKTLTTK